MTFFAHADIEKFLSERGVTLSKESPNPGGGNYGNIEVLDNIVSFSSGNRCVTIWRVERNESMALFRTC